MSPLDVDAGRSTIPHEVAAVLRREGMLATDRGQNSVRSMTSLGDLEAQVENLAAHPWDRGPARQLLHEQIEVLTAEHDRTIDLLDVQLNCLPAHKLWAVTDEVSEQGVHRRDAAADRALDELRSARHDDLTAAVLIIKDDRATDPAISSSTPAETTARDRLLNMGPASPASASRDAPQQHRGMSR